MAWNCKPLPSPQSQLDTPLGIRLHQVRDILSFQSLSSSSFSIASSSGNLTDLSGMNAPNTLSYSTCFLWSRFIDFEYLINLPHAQIVVSLIKYGNGHFSRFNFFMACKILSLANCITSSIAHPICKSNLPLKKSSAVLLISESNWTSIVFAAVLSPSVYKNPN